MLGSRRPLPGIWVLGSIVNEVSGTAVAGCGSTRLVSSRICIHGGEVRYRNTSDDDVAREVKSWRFWSNAHPAG